MRKRDKQELDAIWNAYVTTDQERWPELDKRRLELMQKFEWYEIALFIAICVTVNPLTVLVIWHLCN